VAKKDWGGEVCPEGMYRNDTRRKGRKKRSEKRRGGELRGEKDWFRSRLFGEKKKGTLACG